MIAEHLATDGPMLIDEPEHCAETMLSVLESLWKARTELERLKTPNGSGKPTTEAAKPL
jgi:hypothetical protein